MQDDDEAGDVAAVAAFQARMQSIVAEAVAAEREACALEAANYSQVEGVARVVGLNIAHMIRMRSNNSN